MSYTPATIAPNLNFFQWATKDAPNPTLSAPLFPSDTTVYFSAPPYDHSGAIVTGNFLMGVKNSDSYVMTCYIPPNGVAADGLSATVVQGIRLEGLDYTTSDTSLIPEEGFSAGSAIFCNISGIIQALTMGAIRGTIATNGLGFIIGDGTASNATISHLDNSSAKGFLRKNPTTAKVQYSNDGTNWINIDSVSASNLVQVSSGDTTPAYLESKISAGANMAITKKNTGGNEYLEIGATLPTGVISPATYTPAYLTGDNTAESNYLLWGALTDGSFAITINGTLRTVSGINTVGTTSMADIASRIQTAIRALTTSTETVTWVTDHFVISSVNTTVSSAITVTSATGSGTDISGAGTFGGLGCDTGHGVVTAAVLNQAADSGKVVLLDTNGRINNQLINGVGIASQVYGVDSGSTDTYAITLSPAPSAYYTGMVLSFKANTVNTGACTLNVNGLGAKTIKNNFNSDLNDGDILATQINTVVYDGANFRLINPNCQPTSRKVFIRADQYLSLTGASTSTVGSSGQSILLFRDAQPDSARFLSNIPSWATSISSITVYWLASATTGTVEWVQQTGIFNPYTTVNAQDVNGAYQDVVFTGTNGTAYSYVMGADNYNGLTIAGGSVLYIQLQRNGNAGTDTYGGNAQIIGIEVSYT